ncbi:hypothetical protein FQN53_004516 [Emmonsiellopsis sp. PD_33]|nr:hypothetical protein FQN53_004516 [Emmonsiellopsis sp. PD_33]
MPQSALCIEEQLITMLHGNARSEGGGASLRDFDIVDELTGPTKVNYRRDVLVDQIEGFQKKWRLRSQRGNSADTDDSSGAATESAHRSE